MHNDYILCCASLTGAPCIHGQRGHRAPQSSPRASRRPRSRLELELPCFHGRLRAWEPSLGWGGCWRVRGRGSSLRLEVALHQVLRTAGWQRLIILRTPRGTAPTPVVVAAGRDPQHAAHGAHGEGAPGWHASVRRRCQRLVDLGGKPGRSLCQDGTLHLQAAVLASQSRRCNQQWCLLDT